jgi:hypothetical protein
MAKQPAEPERVGATSSTTFDDLRKQIAERNEQVHKEARELRATHEREKLGIVARHKFDLDR